MKPDLWRRLLGRSILVRQSDDDGFIIAGRTESFGAGGDDFWLVKTDAQGNEEWNRFFAETEYHRATSVQQTTCGGFIIGGYARPIGGGFPEFLLLKTDHQGNKEWSRMFGGGAGNRVSSVQQTACGGFIMAGGTGVTMLVPMGTPSPFDDFCLIKTDPHGNVEWSQTFGEPDGRDFATSVQQTACGGFIIAGWTNSFGAGKSDFWLIKLAPEE